MYILVFSTKQIWWVVSYLIKLTQWKFVDNRDIRIGETQQNGNVKQGVISVEALPAAEPQDSGCKFNIPFVEVTWRWTQTTWNKCVWMITVWDIVNFPYKKGIIRKIAWGLVLPIHTVFLVTIPDCEKPRFKNWFPLTFLMCIIWIGSLSYMVAWMITIVGKWE